MFSPQLRILLLLGSICTILFMMMRIRRSKVLIKDSIFWIIFSLVLLILSIFPELTAVASRLLGIQSPINFVYLFIIFVLLIKIFSSSMEISQLNARLQQLAHRTALNEKRTTDAERGQPMQAPPTGSDDLSRPNP